jgi:hypothetical protein
MKTPYILINHYFEIASNFLILKFFKSNFQNNREITFNLKNNLISTKIVFKLDFPHLNVSVKDFRF